MSIQGNPPALGQLLEQFLKNRLASAEGGLLSEVEAGEVTPYQAVAIHLVEPRTALQEAVEAADYLLATEQASGFRLPAMKIPPDWATLVRSQDSSVAVPFCLGNFPQMVRDVTPLLAGVSATELRLSAGRPIEVVGVSEWGRKMLGKSRFAEAVFAAAALRLANQYDAASELLEEIRRTAPAEYGSVLLNEEAALAWHQGELEEAGRLWAKHPGQQSPAILFNRGLAALFAGGSAEAAPLLTRAADALPESSAWHHLARLYATLAESA